MEGRWVRQRHRCAGTRGLVPVPRVMAESSSGTTAFAAAIPAAERAPLIREAFCLEHITVGWMLIEGVVAIGTGVAARSITLLAFGVDSLIELASAGVLIWRLTVELRRGHFFAEAAERAASRIGGALLFALSAYVVVAAGWSLWTREGQASLLVAGPARWLRGHADHVGSVTAQAADC
jgi:hypothetical protein